ncbi:MAG TPA: S41 family peptidase [Candidatus Absconditabacterales bacterium]|nr:S41 family peptidase [Candidatus Absconditabacterales bacterium]
MSNFGKSLFLLGLGVVLGVSGSGLINYIGNTTIGDESIPTIGDDSELVAGLRRKVKQLDKLTCAERYKKFEDVYKVLQDNYFTSSGVQFGELLEGGLHGFVGGLRDPHTVYFDKQENDSFAKDLKGSYDFEGIGAVIGQSNDQITIMEVIKGSPAHLAGLKPLDIILQVDKKTIDHMSVRDVVNLVRGPKGSTVTLTIFSYKEQKVDTISIVRNTIIIPSVNHKILTRSGKNLGYINIATIGEDTADKFKQSYGELVGSGVQGLIIDLRGNGGGILPVANDIASYFIPKDKIVTITRYKSLPEEIYYSKGLSKKQLPLVVLVDELTASASEILAYALRYHSQATLVGTQTFGKGTIQTLYTLTDNSSIKFTIGKRYGPDNTNVDKVGIKPDVVIQLDTKLFEDKQIDNQLDKAQSVLTTKIK